MTHEIKVNIYDREYIFPTGISLEEIVHKVINQSNTVVLAVVNNEEKELTYKLYENATVSFIDLSTTLGQKTYQRSLSFLFIKATNDIYPNAKVELCHTINMGQYCEIHNFPDFSKKHLTKIKKRMKELIQADLPFEYELLPIDRARDFFRKTNRPNRIKLFDTTNIDVVPVYSLDGYKDYFLGKLVPSTGYINKFAIEYTEGGVILLCPKKSNPEEVQKNNPQPKLIKIFKETKDWSKIHNIRFVGDLNQAILKGEYDRIIQICEALHEYKITKIAEQIYEQKKRIVTIAGPSSSGKTSFSKRLAIQLMVLGLKPVTISLDDYFVNREDTPLDENGNYDFESIYALDLELLNRDLRDLLKGKEVEIPTYNFKDGKREYRGNVLKINIDQPIILEGIHGLNPLLIKDIKNKYIFKIFISPITQLNLDSHNRISTSDCRMIRRMVRDNQHRNINPKQTIQMWDSVRNGEEKYIYPFQEQADAMFNSSLLYELSVLKKFAVPLLKSITKEEKEYSKAIKLLNLLDFFVDINDHSDIPPSSLLREFIGDSNIVH